jgi:hypothetical protein
MTADQGSHVYKSQMLEQYHDHIARKATAFRPSGFAVDESSLPASLFPHQRHGAAFALRAGCSHHRFLPGLVDGEIVDADETDETVTYRMRDGAS